MFDITKEKHLTLDHLLVTMEAHSTNFPMLVDRFRAGTLESLYIELRDYAVEELLMLPLRRMMKDLPLVDDADTANGAVLSIAKMLSDMSGKQMFEVHADMMEAVHLFPTDDIQQAYACQANNRLN